MEERSLEQLEAVVGRLLEEFSRLKSENRRLSEQVAALETGKGLFRERLDLLIDRLDQVTAQ